MPAPLISLGDGPLGMSDQPMWVTIASRDQLLFLFIFFLFCLAVLCSGADGGVESEVKELWNRGRVSSFNPGQLGKRNRKFVGDTSSPPSAW